MRISDWSSAVCSSDLADAAGLVALFRRQLRGQDRDEDDVVDAQHQFERGEGGEGDPDFRVRELFHGVFREWVVGQGNSARRGGRGGTGQKSNSSPSRDLGFFLR